jgi:hypothetical protein
VWTEKVDHDLCDVCFWRTRSQKAEAQLSEAKKLLHQWGRSVTGFETAPYVETADFLAKNLLPVGDAGAEGES